MEEIVKRVISEINSKYAPHTIILYGSYARGDASVASDIDIACFCDNSEVIQDARTFNGTYLDAWVYPTTALHEVSEDALRFGDGIAVLDERGLGTSFIKRVNEKLNTETNKLSESDIAHIKEWVNKMLLRSSSMDLDGNYRRNWLQFELLSIYFEIRGVRFLGHKKSFSYLLKNDNSGYLLFNKMYAQPDNIACLQDVVNHVTNNNECLNITAC